MKGILKLKRAPVLWLGILILSLSYLGSCTKMDEYKKDFVTGDLIYPAKPDTVLVFSGDYRVGMLSVQTSDPNIVKSHIYWDSRSDSTEIDVQKTSGSDTIRLVIDDLLEGAHTFEVVNEDGQGNRSVPVFTIGTVYGDKYRASLINRPIASSYLDTGLQMNLSFADMDLSNGPIGMELHYLKSDGDSATLLIGMDVTDTLLLDYKKGSSVSFRTFFRPDSTSIDTFMTAYETYTPPIQNVWVDLTTKYLKNYGDPFYYSTWDGSRWGILADWVTTEPVKNYGGFGGYEVKNHSMLAMEAGWGRPSFSNGKIYQTVLLPYEGKWRMTINVNDMNDQGIKYIAAALGSSFPDIDQVEHQSISFYEFSSHHAGDSVSLTFEIDSPGEVTLGFVASMYDNGSFFEINSVRLEYNYTSE